MSGIQATTFPNHRGQKFQYRWQSINFIFSTALRCGHPRSTFTLPLRSHDLFIGFIRSIIAGMLRGGGENCINQPAVADDTQGASLSSNKHIHLRMSEGGKQTCVTEDIGVVQATPKSMRPCYDQWWQRYTIAFSPYCTCCFLDACLLVEASASPSSMSDRSSLSSSSSGKRIKSVLFPVSSF